MVSKATNLESVAQAPSCQPPLILLFFPITGLTDVRPDEPRLQDENNRVNWPVAHQTPYYFGLGAGWRFFLGLFFSVKNDAMLSSNDKPQAVVRPLHSSKNSWLKTAGFSTPGLFQFPFWGRFWGGKLPRQYISAPLQPKQRYYVETV